MKKIETIKVKTGSKIVVNSEPNTLYKIQLLDGEEVIIDFKHLAKKKDDDLELEIEKDTKIIFKDFFTFEDVNVVLPSDIGGIMLNSKVYTFIDEAGTLHSYTDGEVIASQDFNGPTPALSALPLLALGGGGGFWRQ